MLRFFLILILIDLCTLCFSQNTNQYWFDKTTFNQINSKKHQDGLYLSYEDLINEKNSFGNQFQMIKSIDTIIYDDNYITYTIEFNDEENENENEKRIIYKKKNENNNEKKDYFDDDENSKKKESHKVFPLICYNDTFYYLIYHDFNKKEYNYAQIPKDKQFHTLNLLIPVELYSYYQGKSDDNRFIKQYLIWNYGLVGAVIASTKKDKYLEKTNSKGFDHLKSKSNKRFDQWGSIIDKYILSTFIFSPIYGGIMEASYNKVIEILEQKPHLKAQIDDKEIVDVGDGMQMPKYKYSRTTIYKLIEKLNEALLKE